VSRKDIQQLLDDVRKQSFAVRMGGSGHWVVTAPDGRTVSVSATPAGGRGRSLTNAKARLRRIGARL
jgi:hypothetical protein